MNTFGIVPLLSNGFPHGEIEIADWWCCLLQTLQEQHIPSPLDMREVSYELIVAWLEHDFVEQIDNNHQELQRSFRQLGLTFLSTYQDPLRHIPNQPVYWSLVRERVEGRFVKAHIRKLANDMAIFDKSQPLETYTLLTWEIEYGFCRLGVIDQEETTGQVIEVHDIELFSLIRDRSLICLVLE